MPIQVCRLDNKPGYKWGKSGGSTMNGFDVRRTEPDELRKIVESVFEILLQARFVNQFHSSTFMNNGGGCDNSLKLD